MRYIETDEEKELRKICDPYILLDDKFNPYIPDDAPKEAHEAYKKLLELEAKRHEEQIREWFGEVMS